MTDVLVPVEVLEGETLSGGLVDLLSPLSVTLLGVHVLPEQTPTDQARGQFEDRGVAALEDLAAQFPADSDVETRLVFTHDKRRTVERVADEVGARTYVVPGAAGTVEALLVPLTGDVGTDRVIGFVEDLIAGRDISATLFLASDDTDAAEALLERSAERLEAAGIEASTRLASGQPFDSLLDAAPDHGAIVMGERAPSLSSLLLGDEAERVAAASVGPVLVVRRPGSGDEDA